MARKLKARGCTGTNFDIQQDPSENINFLAAVLSLGSCTISIVPGGVVVFQPECSTCLNMRDHHTARSTSDTVGDVERSD
eukprot:5136331-Karenia_brevis.AAC.1